MSDATTSTPNPNWGRNPSDPASWKTADGVTTLWMDDGKANVMSDAMVANFDLALYEARTTGSIVVIKGRANVFSGGFDLAVLKGNDRAAKLRMLANGAQLALRLLSHPQPIVAVCAGHAIAMGAFLLLSADYRLGQDGQQVVQANEVAIGMTLPYFALEVLRQRLTPAALTLAGATALPYSAQAGLQAGFYDELAPPDQMDAALERTVARLKKLDRAAFSASKARLRAATLLAMQTAIEQDKQDWELNLPA
jgi:enoyl-CoA hydratase